MKLSSMGRTTFALLALTAMLASGCKKKTPPVVVDDDKEPVQDVETALQIVSASPSSVKPQTPTDVQLFGAGFEDGISVKIAGMAATDVTVRDPNTLTVKTPALPEGTHDVVVANPGGATSTLKAGIRAVSEADDGCRMMAMYFDLDSASLSAQARSALDAAMPCLKQQALIRLEGHADERGTTDYNVALGQRRAETVMRYLVNNGVPQSKLPVVSYGEERPADPGHNEAAWAKNRRVDMRAR